MIICIDLHADSFLVLKVVSLIKIAYGNTNTTKKYFTA
jgi:hypothetical protein